MEFLKVVFIFQLIFISENLGVRLFNRGRASQRLLGKLPTAALNYTGVTQQWFNQTFDHFNPTDTRTFQQKYYVNPNFYKNNTRRPVVFLFLGGEGGITIDWMVQGSWIDYANYFGALCFQLEHRYYGESIPPIEDLSLNNLKYLTSAQAIADVAQFITEKNTELGLPSNVKWVTFGGSYSGALSAWARQKYPHLIHAAVASSAVVLAKVNVPEYIKVVDTALTAYNPLCTSNFQKAYETIYTLLSTKEGQERLNTLFKLCDDISANNSTNDISSFFTSITANIEYVVQYNHDNRIGANPTLSNFTIEPMCDMMLNNKLGEPIERLAAINSFLLNVSQVSCTDYKYQRFVDAYRNESLSSPVGTGGRQWFYQTCMEIISIPTSDYMPQVFGHSLTVDLAVQECSAVFGSFFTLTFMNNSANAVNAQFGGLDAEGTKTIYVVGAFDPWNPIQIWKPANTGSVSVVINASYHGGAHCSDMYPATPNDPPQLVVARTQIFAFLELFLQSH